MITAAKKSSAADLKHFVDFQIQQSTSDGMGGQHAQWVNVFSDWVKLEPVSGRQRMHLDGIQSNITHVVTMRFRDDFSISNENRIVYQGRVFNIHYLINGDEENYFYELAAVEQ